MNNYLVLLYETLVGNLLMFCSGCECRNVWGVNVISVWNGLGDLSSNSRCDCISFCAHAFGESVGNE